MKQFERNSPFTDLCILLGREHAGTGWPHSFVNYGYIVSALKRLGGINK